LTGCGQVSNFIRHMENDNKFLEYLRIDKNNLDLELMKHPVRLASAGARVELLEKEVAEHEETLERISNALYIRFSDQLAEQGKKVTKDYVYGKVKASKKYKMQSKTCREKKEQLGLAKVRYRAFVTKTSMLEQVCFNYRKELEQGHNRIKAKAEMIAAKERRK